MTEENKILENTTIKFELQHDHSERISDEMLESIERNIEAIIDDFYSIKKELVSFDDVDSYQQFIEANIGAQIEDENPDLFNGYETISLIIELENDICSTCEGGGEIQEMNCHDMSNECCGGCYIELCCPDCNGTRVEN